MFEYYEIEKAPEVSQPLMRQTQESVGFLPNLHRLLAAAPATYEAYRTTIDLFTTKTSLTPVEQQVVMMTANFENNCHYCVPAHSWIMTLGKMPSDIIEALREGQDLPDAKLQALHTFTKELLHNRGHIGDDRLQAFLDAGYNQSQALEVLTGLAAKLISNFTNALTHTKLDEPMKAFDWTHPKER